MDSPGLYIHIPFCTSRCGYCTFVSNVYDAASADAYLGALENEWLHKKKLFSAPPSTLFIGGGTPSSLSLAQLARLVKMLPAVAGEATCELNPDTASHDKLSLLYDHGINRCSFGAQTFSPQGRAVLQRQHSPTEVEVAIRNAQKIGFRSINVDLIHGWPGQTKESMIDDINKCVSLGIQHLSYYTLIVDENARAYNELLSVLTDDYDDNARAFWDSAESTLSGYGFRHYETSNYAKNGFECLHNTAIWKGGKYMGLGIAAHSHWGGRRFANTSDFQDYISSNGNGVEIFSEKLEGLEKARETAVFWLRLFDGIDLAEYHDRTGYDFQEVYAVLPFGVELSETHARVPPHLQPVLDAILVDMI